MEDRINFHMKTQGKLKAGITCSFFLVVKNCGDTLLRNALKKSNKSIRNYFDFSVNKMGNLTEQDLGTLSERYSSAAYFPDLAVFASGHAVHQDDMSHKFLIIDLPG